ncbi:MAG TPA: MFS transporter [Stellaceae bacterium]|nr:MFS transporter [Stellaceae bacterium]
MQPEIAVSARPRRGAAVFGLGTAFFFYAFLLRVAPSVMVAELMRDFAVGGAIVGHLSAVYFYAYAGMQIPVGVLFDRFGPRLLLGGAALLAALGSLLFALSHGIVGASLGRLFIGLGSAFSWIGALVLAARFFPARRFPFLTGIAQLVGVAGGVFGQAPLGAAVTALGWRRASMLIGLLGILLAGALWRATPARPSAAAAPGGALHRLRAVAANGQSWLYGFIGMVLTAPILAFAGLWAVPFFETRYGLGRAEAAGMASLFSVGWCAGAPTIGWYATRLRSRRALLALACGALALELTATIYVATLPLAAMSVLALGIGFAGSAMTVTFAGARECNEAGRSGAALGFVNTFVMAGGALFQPLIGLLLDWRWDGAVAAGARIYSAGAYEFALAALPLGAALGALAALRLRDGVQPAR